MEKAWQSFVTTLGDRSWGEQCPTMGVIGVHGGQCRGFHSGGRRHFIQIKSMSQHPAEREEALIKHPLGAGFPLRSPPTPGTHPARCQGYSGAPSLPGYLRPAVPAVALAAIPGDEEAGFLSGEAPQQLQVGDKVQDIIVSSQLSPLGTCLHSHGPATPALCQPSANSQTQGMGTGSTGTPCPGAGHLGSHILGTPKAAPGDTMTHGVGVCQTSTYLSFRTSPARSSPVLQEWMGQENWSPGEGWTVSRCHQSPLPMRAATLGPTLTGSMPSTPLPSPLKQCRSRAMLAWRRFAVHSSSDGGKVRAAAAPSWERAMACISLRWHTGL